MYLSSLEELLLGLLRNADIQGMRAHLSELPYPDIRPDRSTPLLALAAKFSTSPMIALLLDAGANPNLTDYRWQRSALHYAADAGQIDGLVLLLQSGADPNLTSADGKTPLHVAASQPDSKLADCLLEAGADPMRVDITGHRPALQAVLHGRATVLARLLDSMAARSARISDGYGPELHAAARLGHQAITDMLLRAGADITAADTADNQLMHHAVLSGDWRYAMYLLSQGAQHNPVNRAGLQPADLLPEISNDQQRQAMARALSLVS
ncbi:ankyrin repeat domain-containing protein [Salinisphaera sp. P385]|uniref:Ankyrin repeat domain-containing protein n=1 Tax=Spectribacter acetivorans TaxID=3075603 RepID=A0ABU3B7T7_9GAMM|nr:ankyrin repeat domain-containing protein [Salinisphaera sp. P385]MDT0618537.1 ankyrin repeat domain-containing protein [Salinisphaera sp. P385]